MIQAPSLQYIEENPTGHTLKSHIKKKFPEFFEYLESKYNFPCKKWSEKLYMYYHNIEQRPTCPICGRSVEYRTWVHGYNTYCSNACAYKAPERNDHIVSTQQMRYGGIGFASAQTSVKIKETNKKKYGTEIPCTTENIKQKIQKTNIERYGGIGFASAQTSVKIKETNKKKYGTEVPRRNPIIAAKIIQTNLERYGGIGYSSGELRVKSTNTNLERYGVENPIKTPEIRNKFVKRMMDSYGTIYPKQIGLKERHPELISFNEHEWVCVCPHPGCTLCKEKTYITRCGIQTKRVQDGTEQCTKLLPIGDSRSGLERGVQIILDELDVQYKTSVRDIIPPLELDFYLPEHNIAIECNGVYWHSNVFKDSKYHLRKFEMCEKLGIQLISIWEDQWINSPDVIKSFLTSKLGCIKQRIYARECDIRTLDKQHIKFMKGNHIQGACKSQINLGLFYGGELVAAMCFSKRSKLSGGKNDDCWELIRFCNLKHTMVVGGAGRLLKHFIKQHNPTKIVSFSSNDISDGSLYKRLGFQKFSRNVGYWYVDKHMRRYHRTTFTKDNIIRKGLAPTPNKKEWTERLVTDSLGLYRIYDSGTTGWMLLP